MKRVTRWMGCVALLLWVAGPATADVFVTAVINKDKDVDVDERIFIEKDVDIDVRVEAEPEGAAEAQAIVNATNNDNTSDSVEGVTPFDVELDTEVIDSVNENTGVVGLNTSSGSNVNQGNVVSIATSQSGSSFTNAQAEVDQRNEDNRMRQIEDIDAGAVVDIDPELVDTDTTVVVSGSVTGNAGVVGVNANSGFNNNQHNVLALAVGPGGLVALSEAALGQVNSGNQIEAIEVIKVDRIENSVNSNSGHVGVNVSAGSNNNQASASSFAVLSSSVSVNVPGSDL